METFTQRFIRLRKDKKMTQEQLADILHVSRQTISSWEKGRTQPDLETLSQLTQIFQISLDDLILGLEPKTYTPPYKLMRSLLIGNFVDYLIMLIIMYIQKSGINSYFVNFNYLLFYSFLYFPFCCFMRHHDYSLLAGYDDDVEYNETEIQRMLSEMLFLTGSTSLIFTLITIFIIIAQIHLPFPILFVYFVCVTASIITISFKYQNRIMKHPKPQGNGVKAVFILFLLFVAAMVLDVIFTMSYFHIRNNTAEAMILMIFIFLFVGINTGWILYVTSKQKELEKKQLFYHLSSIDVVIIISNLVILALIFAVGGFITK